MKGKSLFIVLVVTLLTIGLVWVVAQALSTESPAPVAPARPMVQWDGTGLPISLEGALRRAEERALAWQADAILVRVDGTWRPGVERLERQVLPVPWSFYYYSPSAQALASAVVDADSTFWIPPLPMRGDPLAELAPFPPAYEPHQVWLTFRGAGGDQFVRTHPDAVVTMVLHMEDGRPVWKMMAISEGYYIEVRIDAETGLVLL
ncbi:MAG: PepSY domain-containing protein [Anaerolineae bacterium]|nr:PepSY domain-containing protein [Anaerolineae bacterium]